MVQVAERVLDRNQWIHLSRGLSLVVPQGIGNAWRLPPPTSAARLGALSHDLPGGQLAEQLRDLPNWVQVHEPVPGSIAKSRRRATSAGSAKWKLTVTCTVTSWTSAARAFATRQDSRS